MAGARRALIVATDDYAGTGLSDLTAPEVDAAQLEAVLADPAIGGFEVTALLNEPEHRVRLAIARFFGAARSSDELLLHVTCHGVKAPDGQLYLATTDTDLAVLSATAVSAEYVNDVMEDSRARSILLMLDCCYAGAFVKGMSAKAAGPVDVDERLGGSGRAVITATDALQFAFEDSTLVHGDTSARPSVFTDVVVTGLRTGAADRDQDGRVTLEEFYSYVYDEVVQRSPQQTPRLFLHDVSGDLVIASRSTPATQPSPLPEHLQEAMASDAYWTRLGVVTPLLQHLTGPHPGRALAARLALEGLARDPDDRVKAEARAALASGPTLETAPPEPEQAPTGPSMPESALDPEPAPSPNRDLAPEASLVLRRGDHADPVPVARWRHAFSRTVAVSVAVVAIVGTAWTLRPGPDATNDRQSPTVTGEIPESVLLLVRRYPEPAPGEPVSELLMVDLSNNDEVTPVANSDGHYLPSIAPDRTHVVTMVKENVGSEVKTARLGRLEDLGSRRLVAESEPDCPFQAQPSWAPGSTRLAVVCLESDKTVTGLFIARLDGSLFRLRVPQCIRPEGPTWGKDDQIYFSCGETVWSVPADGSSGSRPVDDIPADRTISRLDANAEGGLLYLSGEPADRVVVYPTGTPDGGEDEIKPDVGSTVSAPTWAANGAGIAWLEGQPKTWTLMVKDEHTAEPRTVHVPLPGGAVLGEPAWGSR